LVMLFMLTMVFATSITIEFCLLSLLVILISEKQFKKFFTWGHLAGIAIFSVLVFGYYFLYSLDNDIYALLTRMVTESSDRTVVKFGILKTIEHLFTFPFEVFYHFLPWTILVVYLFKKGAFKTIWAHPFLRMNVLLLGANIVLYWTSPQVYARYLLMFPPLMFAPLYYLHQINQAEENIHYKIVRGLLYFIVGIVVVGCISIFFVERISFVPNLHAKAATLCVLCAAALYLLWSSKRFSILYIFLFVVIFRIGFNWFVMPDRNANDYSEIIRSSATEAATAFADQENYAMLNPNVNRSLTYYITRKNKRILQSVSEQPKGTFLSDKQIPNCKVIKRVKSRNPKADYFILNCDN